MRISKKKIAFVLSCLLSLCITTPSHAQETPRLDSIQCFIIGFDIGTLIPSDKGSAVSLANGTTSRNATMHSLYKAPWLDFGINGFYKWKENWLISVEGDFWFGSDNLKHREARMANIYSRDGIIIGTNGTDAVVTAYNRAISIKGGIGKIFPVMPSVNPNSGIFTRLSGGWLQQQTIFTLNEVNAPQVDGDYALLYDHQRQGVMLTEGLGFWFMSNRANLINFYVLFELSQCWSRSTRDYMIDGYLNLKGKDNNRYFDLLYTLKLCWMFPLKGKTIHEYYYF
ncbi:MAG: hypothetical protein IJ620_06435 [Bacteroidales bacterium]|nr:hypothetical protein [Bacteroidales bacterium]